MKPKHPIPILSLLFFAWFFSIEEAVALKGIKSKPIQGVNTALLNHLSKDPIRIVNDKTNNIVYLAKSAASMQLFDSGVSTGPGGWCFIVGKVLQVLPKGMLCAVYANPDGDTKAIFLRNYPEQKSITDDEKIFVIAQRSGNYSYVSTGGGGKTVEAYDYGQLPEKKVKPVENPLPKIIPHEIITGAQAREAISAAQKKAAETERKAIDFQKQRVEDGSAQSQYDWGVRYRDGKGVEQDKAKAKQWFEKSAAQGHTQAKSELEKLKW